MELEELPTPRNGSPVEVPPLPRDFALGLVVAPTAGGKTSALAALVACGITVGPGKALSPSSPEPVVCLPGFSGQGGTTEGACARLSAAGLGSVPTWIRPYNVLSQGERCRVAVALRLQDGCVLDDFGATVSRVQARGMAAGLGRRVRACGYRRVVVATVHEGLEPWLGPDWVWTPTDGCLRTSFLAISRPLMRFEDVAEAPEETLGLKAPCGLYGYRPSACEWSSVRPSTPRADHLAAFAEVERLYDFRPTECMRL